MAIEKIDQGRQIGDCKIGGKVALERFFINSAGKPSSKVFRRRDEDYVKKNEFTRYSLVTAYHSKAEAWPRHTRGIPTVKDEMGWPWQGCILPSTQCDNYPMVRRLAGPKAFVLLPQA